MNIDDSIAFLKSEISHTQANREQVYTSAREGVLQEIASAPTPALKARYQRKLDDLEASFAASKPASAVNLPTTARELSGSADAEIKERPPTPEVQSLPKHEHLAERSAAKPFPIKVVGIFVLVAAAASILLYVKLNDETPSTSDQTVSDSSVSTIAPPVSETKEQKTLIVTTERQNYQNGDDVVCMVNIPFDGHLRIYSIDVNGSKTQIFPNGFEPNGAVRAGTQVRVPGNSDYTLKLSLPSDSEGGSESVVAVLSAIPFDGGQEISADNPFPTIETSTNLKTRGLSPQTSGNSVSGEKIYRVTP